MAKSASRSATSSDQPRARLDGLQELGGKQQITAAGIDAFADLIEEHPELGTPQDVAAMRLALKMRERLEATAPGCFHVVPGTSGPITIMANWDGEKVTAETFGVLAELFPDLTIHSGRLDADGMFRWTVSLPPEAPKRASAEAGDDPQ